jgi:hypothetical protein
VPLGMFCTLWLSAPWVRRCSAWQHLVSRDKKWGCDETRL